MHEQTITFNPGFIFTPGQGTAYGRKVLAAAPAGNLARADMLRSAIREVTAPDSEDMRQDAPCENSRAYYREVLAALLEEMTLTEVLAALGFRHVKSSGPMLYAHDVLDEYGCRVFSGTASETWAWLRSTRRLP